MARICNAERVRFGVASGHERKTLSLSLPAERFGSASAIHKRFLEWERVVWLTLLERWLGGVRRHAGHRLAMAKHRWHDDQGCAEQSTGCSACPSLRPATAAPAMVVRVPGSGIQALVDTDRVWM
jgi:hypothetical protein